LHEEASLFWIILLLVQGDPEHPRIKVATPGMPQKALTNVRFRTKADKADFSARMVCPLMTQSGHQA
jgi:hypothetical protein